MGRVFSFSDLEVNKTDSLFILNEINMDLDNLSSHLDKVLPKPIEPFNIDKYLQEPAYTQTLQTDSPLHEGKRSFNLSFDKDMEEVKNKKDAFTETPLNAKIQTSFQGEMQGEPNYRQPRFQRDFEPEPLSYGYYGNPLPPKFSYTNTNANALTNAYGQNILPMNVQANTNPNAMTNAHAQANGNFDYGRNREVLGKTAGDLAYKTKQLYQKYGPTYKAQEKSPHRKAHSQQPYRNVKDFYRHKSHYQNNQDVKQMHKSGLKQEQLHKLQGKKFEY